MVHNLRLWYYCANGVPYLQETIDGFLCLLIVFVKNKTHQSNFEGRDYIE